jgi:DNA polymerase-3 subunit delta
MIYKSYLIEKDLQKIKNNFMLFYGENLGLKEEFKKKIKSINSIANVQNLTQEKVLSNKENFYNEVFTNSLFESEKIFFINNSDDKIIEIIEGLETKEHNRKIYFFSDILDKRSKLRTLFEKSNEYGIVPCYQDNEITLKKIIQEKLEKFKGLNQENLNLILDNCDFDRIKLENELNKIISCFTGLELEKTKLESLLNIKQNENFNTVKNEALIGNKAQVNKLISDTYIENEKSLYYLNLINHRLLKLFEIQQNSKKLSKEVAVNSIKPPIFWKEKPAFISQLNKWDKIKITQMLKTTYNLEKKIKTVLTINRGILIKKLLIDLCNTANA